MKTYQGIRDDRGASVVVSNRAAVDGKGFVSSGLLDPRFDLRRHSPTGFEWGYGGSGPAQLAVALVADATGDDALAQRVYQDFKFKIVAALSSDGWIMTSDQIRMIAAALDPSPPAGYCPDLA